MLVFFFTKITCIPKIPIYQIRPDKHCTGMLWREQYEKNTFLYIGHCKFEARIIFTRLLPKKIVGYPVCILCTLLLFFLWTQYSVHFVNVFKCVSNLNIWSFTHVKLSLRNCSQLIMCLCTVCTKTYFTVSLKLITLAVGGLKLWNLKIGRQIRTW